VGFLDKAKEMLGKHDAQVDKGIDRAGQKAKERFQGHDEQIDKITQMGKDHDFSGQGTQAGEPSGAEAAPGGSPPPAAPGPEGQPPER
jgi:hypothetical protein